MPDEQLKLAKSSHDIRASLAITNGFNQALESTFSELCETYEQLLLTRGTRSTTDVDLIKQLDRLEADCHFCMSRIKRSLEQLGSRIDYDLTLRSANRAKNDRDIP